MFNSLQETLKSATASGLHETRENWKESLLPASSRQVPLSFQQPLGGDGRRIISAAQAASVPIRLNQAEVQVLGSEDARRQLPSARPARMTWYMSFRCHQLPYLGVAASRRHGAGGSKNSVRAQVAHIYPLQCRRCL